MKRLNKLGQPNAEIAGTGGRGVQLTITEKGRRKSSDPPNG